MFIPTTLHTQRIAKAYVKGSLISVSGYKGGAWFVTMYHRNFRRQYSGYW